MLRRSTFASHRPRTYLTLPPVLQACLRLGIDPSTLVHRPYEHFLRQERSPELAKLAFEHEEKLRQDRLHALVEERRRLEDAARGTAHGMKVLTLHWAPLPRGGVAPGK